MSPASAGGSTSVIVGSGAPAPAAPSASATRPASPAGHPYGARPPRRQRAGRLAHRRGEGLGKGLAVGWRHGHAAEQAGVDVENQAGAELRLAPDPDRTRDVTQQNQPGATNASHGRHYARRSTLPPKAEGRRRTDTRSGRPRGVDTGIKD
jgi:hypothetical protein